MCNGEGLLNKIHLYNQQMPFTNMVKDLNKSRFTQFTGIRKMMR